MILDDPTEIPKDFLFLWEKMLKNIHTCGMLPVLIKTLLKVVNNEQDTIHRRKMASLWLVEIGKCINKCISAQYIYCKIPVEVSVRTWLDLYKLVIGFIQNYSYIFIICM